MLRAQPPAEAGTRPARLPFSRELWIEGEDFMEVPSKGYCRLFPGNMVRLRYGYVVECTGCDKDENGKVVAVHCNYLPETKSGTPGADTVQGQGQPALGFRRACLRRRSAALRPPVQVPAPGARREAMRRNWNAISSTTSIRIPSRVITAQLEAGAAAMRQPEDRFQFERHGYFVADRVDSQPGAPVFNRAVTLKDSWGKGA